MKKILYPLLSTLIFNTAIAGVLSLSDPHKLFWTNFIYSQCIGFSVMGVNATVFFKLKNSIKRWAVMCFSLPGSVALGMTLAFAISGQGGWHCSRAKAKNARSKHI
jgi:fucose 4-O-acetylase-like acetyltransferase